MSASFAIVYRVTNTVEYFFVYRDQYLQIPNKLPKKYEDRVKLQFTVDNINFFHVQSIQYEKPHLVKKEDILTGAWICYGDCIKRGEFKPQNIEGSMSFFGIPIFEPHGLAIQKLNDILCNEEKVPVPIVTYHGTSQENEEGILKEGLRETFGMLGDGIYTGTFYKAARFAAWGQEYKARKGTIFRCMLFCKRVLELPRENYVCECCESRISDHKNTWSETHDCVHVSPCEDTSGFCRDGSKKYLLRNEEYCSKKATITSYARLDTSTYSFTYDPNYRKITII